MSGGGRQSEKLRTERGWLDEYREKSRHNDVDDQYTHAAVGFMDVLYAAVVLYNLVHMRRGGGQGRWPLMRELISLLHRIFLVGALEQIIFFCLNFSSTHCIHFFKVHEQLYKTNILYKCAQNICNACSHINLYISSWTVIKNNINQNSCY